jgi:hypothetical protein
MLEKLIQRVSRTYLKGLRTDVGRMVIPSKPVILVEAEKEAGDIERYLREEQRRQIRLMNRHPERRSQSQRSTTNQGAISCRNPVPTDEKKQTKCFKCGKIGHIAPQCSNFQPLSQRKRPPSRVNQIETRIG